MGTTQILKRNSLLKEKIKFLKIQFVIDPRNVDSLMDQLILFQPANSGPIQCAKLGQWNTAEKVEKVWTQKINLNQIPTKPEDLSLKMTKETNTLSVSGKCEVTKERPGGMKIFSTHTWSKDLKVPDGIDQSTLKAKMSENILKISAEFQKHEITIERAVEEEPQQETQKELEQEKIDLRKIKIIPFISVLALYIFPVFNS